MFDSKRFESQGITFKKNLFKNTYQFEEIN